MDFSFLIGWQEKRLDLFNNVGYKYRTVDAIAGAVLLVIKFSGYKVVRSDLRPDPTCLELIRVDKSAEFGVRSAE
jgi:hypothetical protein